MDELKDIRWQQRFANFNKAFGQLTKFIQHKQLNELEAQGLIKAFEYTYELAWKTLQDLLRYKGYENIAGPKPVIEQSYQDAYIKDGKGWLRMHKSRNLATYTYDEATAAEIIEAIRSEYVTLLTHLKLRLEKELLNPHNALLDE